MLVVPLQPLASQIVNTSLSGQACTINVYQLSTGLYTDLYVNNFLIIGGVICEDRNVIVRNSYLGFIGDLAFFDTQGSIIGGIQSYSDPSYTGLGTRFLLVYLLPSDLPPGIS